MMDIVSMRKAFPGDSEICVFKPKVQVLDNWGFCNGLTVPGMTGYYNDTDGVCDVVEF